MIHATSLSQTNVLSISVAPPNESNLYKCTLMLLYILEPGSVVGAQFICDGIKHILYRGIATIEQYGGMHIRRMLRLYSIQCFPVLSSVLYVVYHDSHLISINKHARTYARTIARN